MKIITWNCSGAFRKKNSLLKKYESAVLIIQECEDPMQVSYPEPLEYDHIWRGKIRIREFVSSVRKNLR